MSDKKEKKKKKKQSDNPGDEDIPEGEDAKMEDTDENFDDDKGKKKKKKGDKKKKKKGDGPDDESSEMGDEPFESNAENTDDTQGAVTLDRSQQFLFTSIAKHLSFDKGYKRTVDEDEVLVKMGILRKRGDDLSMDQRSGVIKLSHKVMKSYIANEPYARVVVPDKVLCCGKSGDKNTTMGMTDDDDMYSVHYSDIEAFLGRGGDEFQTRDITAYLEQRYRSLKPPKSDNGSNDPSNIVLRARTEFFNYHKIFIKHEFDCGHIWKVSNKEVRKNAQMDNLQDTRCLRRRGSCEHSSWTKAPCPDITAPVVPGGTGIPKPPCCSPRPPTPRCCPKPQPQCPRPQLQCPRTSASGNGDACRSCVHSCNLSSQSSPCGSYSGQKPKYSRDTFNARKRNSCQPCQSSGSNQNSYEYYVSPNSDQSQASCISYRIPISSQGLSKVKVSVEGAGDFDSQYCT